MELLVGCPVRDRASLLPLWFTHLVTAVEHAKHLSDLAVLMVCSPDDPSAEIAQEEAAKRHIELVLVDSGERFCPYSRVWNGYRYEHMTSLRNRLLSKVRELNPTLFWSLDSDILVAENSLDSAMTMLMNDDYDAVGTKLHMHRIGRRHPSYAHMNRMGIGGLRRSDSIGQFPVDVIMASKLMTVKAYNVDYESHPQGEDIGWSLAAVKAGCRLGWDGTSCSKHVFNLKRINEIDERCGF